MELRYPTRESVSRIGQLARAGGSSAAICVTAIGFFCDFVKPQVNLIPIFGAISVVVTAAVAGMLHRRRVDLTDSGFLESRLGQAFGFLILADIFWACMIPVFALTPEAGIAATLAPDLQSVQEAVLGKIDRLDRKVDSGFDTVIQKLDQLGAKDATISDPKSANDHYYNARIYELRGNLIEARRSYEAYLKAGLEYIDPVQAYADVLKNLEGKTAAREFLGRTRDLYPNNPAVQLTYALTNDSREDRIQLLERLAVKFPNYGPVVLALGEQFSRHESGFATVEERRKERDLFATAFRLEESQKVSKYFLDKRAAKEKLSFANEELKRLREAESQTLDVGLAFKVDVQSKSATITFVPPEQVLRVMYRLDDQQDWRDTGMSPYTLPGQSGPSPNLYAMVSISQGAHRVFGKYVDLKGHESKVFDRQFDVAPVWLQPLNRVPNFATGETEYILRWGQYDPQEQFTAEFNVDSEVLRYRSNQVVMLRLTKGGALVQVPMTQLQTIPIEAQARKGTRVLYVSLHSATHTAGPFKVNFEVE